MTFENVSFRYAEDRPYDVLDLTVNQTWKYQRGEDSNAPSVTTVRTSSMRTTSRWVSPESQSVYSGSLPTA